MGGAVRSFPLVVAVWGVSMCEKGGMEAVLKTLVSQGHDMTCLSTLTWNLESIPLNSCVSHVTEHVNPLRELVKM